METTPTADNLTDYSLYADMSKGVRRILVRGSMPPCRLRRRKFDYEMMHSEVYLNKYVVSIAPFSTPAFTPTPIQQTALFRMFSLFNFFIHLPEGSADSLCRYVRMPMDMSDVRNFHESPFPIAVAAWACI